MAKNPEVLCKQYASTEKILRSPNIFNPDTLPLTNILYSAMSGIHLEMENMYRVSVEYRNTSGSLEKLVQML